MAKKLIIVESPAKIKTLKKYLSKDFQILASYGHVRDLLPKKGSVDPEHKFAMKYVVIEKNQKHVDAIAKELKSSETLYLATDPDREGEAISWHICEIMKAKKLLKDKTINRIVFHELTKSAIQEAVAHPRSISMALVNAQQARRALDYLVGFNLSPLLWKKIRRGLSAGRVQSPALRLIVERELEIEKFVTQEYWSIIANISAHNQNFNAKLIEYKQEKLKQFSITQEAQAGSIKQDLLAQAKGKLTVKKIEKKQRKRNPAPPFITSTLQQEAARKLYFTAQKTMRTAQQLYENGFITYMRTDSFNLANEALQEIREYITKRYGKDNLPESPHFYKTKSKNAQEAHEAIRPTSVFRIPKQLASDLNSEQLNLYELIWKRTLACQMVHATINTIAIDLTCGFGNIFRANGSTIADPGFIVVYQEGVDDNQSEAGEETILPPLKEGDMINLLDILGEQHFTEPPPRYTESSLIKTLEEYGIGRPSTYAAIISTLQNREYALLENKRFKPTDVGRIVNEFLTKYFMRYVDYDFTAKLEDQLDAVSRGEAQWIPLLDEFWSPFKQLVDKIESSIERKEVTQKTLDEKCPKCGKPLAIRLGRRGSFIGCTGYPECDYARDLDENQAEASAPAEIVEGRLCPNCNSTLQIKSGRYGKFIGCSNYPECKYIESLNKPIDTGVKCPVCYEGTLLKRFSRHKKIFYSCSSYPKCKYAIWNEPLNEKCPKCGWPILTLKTTKKHGIQKVCPQKECGYSAAR